MATFAKASFNASVYSSSRPTYPRQLFEYVFSFHRKGSKAERHPPLWETAVDLGCGTGQATTQLTPFRQVIGIDPSERMLEKARANVGQSQSAANSPTFRFVQGSGEDLSKIFSDDSVDLIVAAQSCHWFDWSKVWPETQRVLRPGGSAAFWVYTEFRLTDFPSLAATITEYAQGSNPRMSLGPHFERPGRTILERYLVDVPEPFSVLKNDTLEELQRVYFCGDEIPAYLPDNASKEPILLRREMRWRDLLGYFRTFSALHNYHEKYPEDISAKEDERFLNEDLTSASEPHDDLRGGDIAIRFWKDLRQGVLDISSDNKVGAEDKVQVEWPVALLLVRKQ